MFSGYIYPNEYELQWSLLIVLYPYLTGLVAGAFILASLERVFNVKALVVVYRLSLLTALAFLIVAPIPLLAHLGHPERSFEMFLTPHLTSAMAMFGFVYAWYLLVVLLLEVWFDYRKDIVLWSRQKKGIVKYLYRLMTLGTTDISEKAVRFDEKAGKFITIIGIPSAFLLHGYVGFIFGSVKANPWWSTSLMPIIFLLSAIVYGVSFAFFGLSRSFPLSLLLLLIVGATDTRWGATRSTILQLETTEAMRGRVMGVFQLSNRGLNPLGQTETGLMVPLVGAREATFIGGLFVAAVTLFTAWRVPSLPRFRDPHQ